MNPFIERLPNGKYRCHPCDLTITGHKDAETHGTAHHRIPLDYLAQDEAGHWYDLRGMDLPQLLREGGLA